MHFTTVWPNTIDLGLPSDTHQSLMALLIEPFEDESAVRQYWADNSGTLIILQPEDDQATLARLMPAARHQVLFALTYPEFTVPVGSNYQLSLAVVSDDGAGVYLLTHLESPLLKGQTNV